MILDHLDNWKRYAGLNPWFRKAFEFLQRKGLGDLPAGRHAIESDRLYAVVVRDNGGGREKARLETHRKYIDIQFCLSGTEEIGWKPAARCAHGSPGYDEARDLELFSDMPESWAATPPGTFAIFFPEDAHAPMGGLGPIHKIVVKILSNR